MKVRPTDSVTFGHHHKLKTLWLRGKFPSVKFGVYGDLLTKDTVSLEHFQPISKGGKTTLGNLGLASKNKNNLRGNQPLKNFLTLDMLQKYLKQFRGIKVKDFNGDTYEKLITENVGKILE